MIQNTPLVALPTKYGGITYRSRREARWALFLTALGVRFEYEPEGFDLDGVWYLPDFLIPDQPRFPGGFWLEVKGAIPCMQEKQKLGLLVVRSEIKGCIVNEIPDNQSHAGWTCFLPPVSDPMDDQAGDWYEDGPYYFCKCRYCGKIGFEYSGWADRICGEGGKQSGDEHPDILQAYSMARTERFGT